MWDVTFQALLLALVVTKRLANSGLKLLACYKQACYKSRETACVSEVALRRADSDITYQTVYVTSN